MYILITSVICDKNCSPLFINRISVVHTIILPFAISTPIAHIQMKTMTLIIILQLLVPYVNNEYILEYLTVIACFHWSIV